MPSTRVLLEALLTPFSDKNKGTLDFNGIHGFLTALLICPVELSEQQRNEQIFDDSTGLTGAQAKELNRLVVVVQTDIDRAFNEEDGFSLPCQEEQEKHDDLVNWCTGFMVAHFLDGDAWFTRNEQEVCELLLPIMLASGLFDEEPDFIEILNDPELTEDMFSQIPEVLMELYLMFQSPEDKKSHQSK